MEVINLKIVTIEPTPSPNTMKVVINEELPFGKSYNYTEKNKMDAPKEIQEILNIEGVKGVYHVADFLAVERIAKFQWEGILSQVRKALGENSEDVEESAEQAVDHFGEVYVHVQMFRGIPLQIKVFDSSSEHRISTGERFVQAFQSIKIDQSDENYILERKWADFGIRYGDKEEIAESVLKEIEATYPEERVAKIVESANAKKTETVKRQKSTVEEFSVDDWKERFQMLDQIPDPELDDLPLLEKALEDEQMSIRRLATVYLGMIEDKAVVPLLSRALKDKSAAVRRTAGDCMSDLGFVEFEPAMMEALKDKNKLVRWRAAMFLYESGTENSLPALKEAENDPEFEVKLQVKMAIARIEQGEEAKGSVWKQMMER